MLASLSLQIAGMVSHKREHEDNNERNVKRTRLLDEMKTYVHEQSKFYATADNCICKMGGVTFSPRDQQYYIGQKPTEKFDPRRRYIESFTINDRMMAILEKTFPKGKDNECINYYLRVVATTDSVQQTRGEIEFESDPLAPAKFNIKSCNVTSDGKTLAWLEKKDNNAAICIGDVVDSKDCSIAPIRRSQKIDYADFDAVEAIKILKPENLLVILKKGAQNNKEIEIKDLAADSQP